MRDLEAYWRSVLRLGALILATLVFCVTLVAVTWEMGIWEAPVIVVAESKSAGIGNYEDLMAALRGGGRTVRPDGEYSEPFFQVSGRVVYVDDAQVLVFEYPTEQDREGESRLISANGSSVGSTQITWTHQPNFFAGGRVIVQYLGSDLTVLGLLRNTLGTPITTQRQASASSR